MECRIQPFLFPRSPEQSVYKVFSYIIASGTKRRNAPSVVSYLETEDDRDQGAGSSFVTSE